ncbi:MAG TPA: hypothetical protein VK525_16880 [Candidatus Saccharimonadales bacterium]|nr:hypothetical protein [Candidatus Saccharimonadales bacterium]
MPSNYDLIYQAIKEKKPVTANYDGYSREMCPHVLGTKDGVMHVLSLQYAGGSSKGLPPGGQWKCMDVEGLSSITLTNGAWVTGPRKTDKPQSCVAEIHIEIPY